MATIDLVSYLSVCAAGFGLLWCFLTIRKHGVLELIERTGFVLAAWARSQKYATKWRQFEYQAMRTMASLPDEETALREWHQVVAR